MAGVLQDQRGGILGLLNLPWEQWEALVADLARMGWRVDQIPHQLDWVAVAAIARHCAEGSALYQARRIEKIGARAEWSADRHINVSILDQLRIANWYTAAENAAKARKTIPPPPQPTPRPGDEEELDASGFPRNANGTRQVGHDPIPMDQFDSWWNASNEDRESWGEAA